VELRGVVPAPFWHFALIVPVVIGAVTAAVPLRVTEVTVAGGVVTGESSPPPHAARSAVLNTVKERRKVGNVIKW
jgi:hypothetical protein